MFIVDNTQKVTPIPVVLMMSSTKERFKKKKKRIEKQLKKEIPRTSVFQRIRGCFHSCMQHSALTCSIILPSTGVVGWCDGAG